LIPINDENTIEKKLIPICYALSPSALRKRDRETLNSLPELKEFPTIKEPKKTKKKKKVKPSLMVKNKPNPKNSKPFQ
jgi:hypothetical protein